MSEVLVDKLHSLLDILYDENPEESLIVFDKHSNGYCIDEVKFCDNKVSLISHQELIEDTFAHLSIKTILSSLIDIDPQTEVEVLITITNSNHEFANEFNSIELYLQI